MLASDLKAFPADKHSCTLLQDVDNLLLARQMQEGCLEGTQQLLTLLWEAGYKVSSKKAQICQEKVKSFHLPQGQCQFGPEIKQAICSILVLST